MDHGSGHGQGTARRLARSGARGGHGLSQLGSVAPRLVSLDGQPLTARTPRQIAEDICNSEAFLASARNVTGIFPRDQEINRVVCENAARVWGKA